jgi:hypothetical protein
MQCDETILSFFVSPEENKMKLEKMIKQNPSDIRATQFLTKTIEKMSKK